MRPLTMPEVNRLKEALTANGNDGAALVIGKDTSFAGTAPALPDDAKVITAVASVPSHY